MAKREGFDFGTHFVKKLDRVLSKHRHKTVLKRLKRPSNKSNGETPLDQMRI